MSALTRLSLTSAPAASRIAGADVSESRVKALIAALEDVDIDEAISEAAAVPAGGAGGAGGAAAVPEGDSGEEADEELPDTTEEEEAGGDDDEEEDEDAGEGLGELFG